MCQDEWLNESVIPSANENATACVTKRLRGACTGSFRNIYHRTDKLRKHGLHFISDSLRMTQLLKNSLPIHPSSDTICSAMTIY